MEITVMSLLVIRVCLFVCCPIGCRYNVLGRCVDILIPSFWIIVFIILFEGMLGRAVYADAFYSISVELSRRTNPLSIVRNS